MKRSKAISITWDFQNLNSRKTVELFGFRNAAIVQEGRGVAVKETIAPMWAFY